LNFRGHLISGLILFFPVNYALQKSIFLSNYNFFAGLGVFLIFSLIPDIDTDSYIQTYFYLVVFTTDIYLIYTAQLARASMVGLLALLPVIAKHRGFCHSFAFGAIISIPFAYFSISYSILAFAGFVTHRLGDLT